MDGNTEIWKRILMEIWMAHRWYMDGNTIYGREY